MSILSGMGSGIWGSTLLVVNKNGISPEVKTTCFLMLDQFLMQQDPLDQNQHEDDQNLPSTSGVKVLWENYVSK
jgi:hypothetical protein